MSNQADTLAPPKKNGKKKRFSFFSKRKSKVEQQTKPALSNTSKALEASGSDPAIAAPQDSSSHVSFCVRVNDGRHRTVMVDPQTDPFLRKFARKSHTVTASSTDRVLPQAPERSLPMALKEETVEKPEEEATAVPEETQKDEKDENAQKDEDGEAAEENGEVGKAEEPEVEGSTVPEETQEGIEMTANANGAISGEQEGIESAGIVGGAVAGAAVVVGGAMVAGDQEETEQTEDSDAAVSSEQEETAKAEDVENAGAETMTDGTETPPGPPPGTPPETPGHEENGKHVKMSTVATLAQNFVTVGQHNHELNEKNKVKHSIAHKLPTPVRGKKVIDPPAVPPPPPQHKAEVESTPQTPVRKMKREFSIQVHQHKKHQEDLVVKNSTAAKFKEQVTSKTSKTAAVMAFKFGLSKTKDKHSSTLGVTDSIKEHDEEE